MERDTSEHLIRAERERIAQAHEQLGKTEVSPATANTLLAVFVLIMAAVPSFDTWRSLASASPSPFVRFGSGLRSLVTTFRDHGLFAANRQAKDEFDRFEEQLEEESMTLDARALVQAVLSNVLREGNEQVYVGHDDWLYYRQALDHVTGPGFLDQRPDPDRANDPVAAIVDFDRQLEARRIELIVMPVPGKPSVHPEHLNRPRPDSVVRTGPRESVRLVRNPDSDRFRRTLERHGVAVLDIAPLLAERAAVATDVYLRTDSHWSPATVDAVAAHLGQHLFDSGLATRRQLTLRVPVSRREHELGDLAKMLRLSHGAERYREVIFRHDLPAHDGSPWRPDKGSPVLLLGDSFSNVYSSKDLGWGESAGLAEQLSVVLGFSIDRIAVNDDGAFRTREALRRDLADGRDRLAAKRVVIWEFAERELSYGDWKLIELPDITTAAPPVETDESSGTLEVRGRVREVTLPPRPGITPYRDCLTAVWLTEVTGDVDAGEILVFTWGMRDNLWTDAASIRVGSELELTVVRWHTVSDELESFQRIEPDDEEVLLLDVYWAGSGGD